ELLPMNRSFEIQVTQPRSMLAVCGLAIALLLGVLPISNWVVHGNAIGPLLAREAIGWGSALVVLLWLKFVGRVRLSSLCVCRPTGKGVIIGVLTAIVLVATQVIQFSIIIPLFHLNTGAIMTRMQAIMNTPYWYRILLVLRAAVTEEIIFRGYIIEK